MRISSQLVFLATLVATVWPVGGQGLSWNQPPEADPFAPFRRPLEVTGTVSLAELRNPLTGKALEMIITAERHLRFGETDCGMEMLRTALTNPQAAPFALGVMGTEHLRQNMADEALVELEQSVQLMPGNATTQSNLAYALFLKGRDEEGVLHARKALQLDPGRPKTRYVLGKLLIRLGRLEEAKFHLRLAATDIPSAGILLEKLEQ